MPKWKKSKSRRRRGSGRTVSVSLPRLRIMALHIATPSAGSHFEYLYRNGNTHAIAPGPLDWWARGTKFTTPEWVSGRPARNDFPACVHRKQPLDMRVKLSCSTPTAITGKLIAAPLVDGSNRYLKRSEFNFTYPAGATEHWITVQFSGKMPDEVGRYRVQITWQAQGTGFTFNRRVSNLRLYSVYERPFNPDYDSGTDSDPGTHTTTSEGTLSGTPKRLDKLTLIIGGRNRRHRTSTNNEIIDLLWRLHIGINDTPGAPPYFDAGHDRHITHNGTGSGVDIPVEDQWLAWIRTSNPHWNDASCIGHVQILKTMAATVGFFARRTWVFPTTPRMPDGSTVTLADTDCYCLGTYTPSRRQSWTFTVGSHSYTAHPKLMEPGTSWENFEACLRSPNGRFLPGGYNTSSCPASFRNQKGFPSAKALLRWWTNTSRSGFGRRFMCWVYYNQVTGIGYCWDVEGNRYPLSDYVQIRTNGKTLPPP